MATLKEFILIHVLCLAISVAQRCDDRTVLHESKDGTYFCCERTECSMGTYPTLCSCEERDVQSCSKESIEIKCEHCPEGTFMSNRTPSNVHIYQCLTKRTCDESQGMVTTDEGSRDEDRKCACNLESGYYDYDFREPADDGPHYCLQKQCPAGEELHEDGECKKCHVGEFKKEKGYHQCRRWTDCHKNKQVIVEYGNTTRDMVCGDPEEVTVGTPRIGGSTDDDEDDGVPYEMIGGIIAGILVLLIIFGVAMYFIHKSRFTRDKDAEKQSFKGREEVASTVSSVPPYTKSPLSLDITKANKSFNKKRHGSSPDSGIADMKGYAPYFPSSEKLGSQNNGQSFQYARDIQEDCGSTGDEHNTSFQEPIPEEDKYTCPEDCKSVDTVESIPPVVNHYYYFPPNGNVNLQVGKDNKLYSGGAPIESPPTPDDYNYNGMDYNVPVHTVVHDPNYNTSKHTVV